VYACIRDNGFVCIRGGEGGMREDKGRIKISQ
jgi:hypothetical protein